MWIYVITSQALLFAYAVNSQSTSAPTCYTPHVSGPGSTCQDKYAAIPGHINCLQDHPNGRPSRVTPEQETEIEKAHNDIRSNVFPKAGNMMDISYSKGQGNTALRLSRHCLPIEHTWHQRTTPGAYHPGQNMYVSSTPMNWTDVIQAWASESASFTYGVTKDPTGVSNYTQMIWAETVNVGCGASHCATEGFYIYICHYGPTYDVSRLDTPYVQANNSCALCPSHCNTNGTSTLCDCRGALCLGGSKLNLDTCSCECIAEVNTYNGTLCELECEVGGDDPQCGSAPYTKDTCSTNLSTMFHCPWMCNACPYADKEYKEGSELLPWQKGLPLCTTTSTPAPTSAGQTTPGTARAGVTTKGSSAAPTSAPTPAPTPPPTPAPTSTRPTTQLVNGTGNGSNKQWGQNIGTRPGSLPAICAALLILMASAFIC